MAKPGFMMYHGECRALGALNDASFRRVIEGMLKYSETGEEPELKDTTERVVFGLMRTRLDEDDARYQSRIEAGRKGGVASGEARRSNTKQREVCFNQTKQTKQREVCFNQTKQTKQREVCFNQTKQNEATRSMLQPNEANEATRSMLQPNEANEATRSMLQPNEANEATRSMLQPNEANEATRSMLQPNEANEATRSMLQPNEANEATRSMLQPNEANEATRSMLQPNEANEATRSMLQPNEANEATRSMLQPNEANEPIQYNSNTIPIQYNSNTGNSSNSYAREEEEFPPTVEMVEEYVREKGLNVDAQEFIDRCEANGWLDGKGRPVINWRTWLTGYALRAIRPEEGGAARLRPDPRLAAFEAMKGGTA